LWDEIFHPEPRSTLTNIQICDNRAEEVYISDIKRRARINARASAEVADEVSKLVEVAKRANRFVKCGQKPNKVQEIREQPVTLKVRKVAQ
jgi:hypothetical protein